VDRPTVWCVSRAGFPVIGALKEFSNSICIIYSGMHIITTHRASTRQCRMMMDAVYTGQLQNSEPPRVQLIPSRSGRVVFSSGWRYCFVSFHRGDHIQRVGCRTVYPDHRFAVEHRRGDIRRCYDSPRRASAGDSWRPHQETRPTFSTGRDRRLFIGCVPMSETR
jgi:hypothetical protein